MDDNIKRRIKLTGLPGDTPIKFPPLLYLTVFAAPTTPLAHTATITPPSCSPSMADPLGIITSALHAAHKVYEVVKTIKDAPEEIQSLQDQVELLYSILPRINDFPHRAGESASISLLVAKAEELNSSLDKFLNKTTKISQGKRKVKKLKWWFNADEAKSLTGKLSVFYGALSALHSIESSGHIHTRFSDLEESFTSTNEHLQGCFTEVHTHLDAQLVGVREIFQEELAKSSEELMHSLLASRVRELRTLANEQRRGESHGFDQNSVLYNMDYVEQVADVLSVSQDQADDSSTSARLDHTSSTVAAAAVYYPPPSLSSLETPCKHCGCQCHGAQSLWRTPESLASIIGHHYLKIPFPRRLWPGLIRCDVPTCKKGWLIQVRSFLPYWFARIEMQMRFEMLPVHFCIQTPRVNTDIKWHLGRMVLERGADVFKELLRSRRVTINDVDENGYSLLHVRFNVNLDATTVNQPNDSP
ncbi:hypothetical protein PHLCEN_2v9973 [Hermanssonia centrifuga]|uniref:Fungal N-terminal domain-containing protein n=1 Tax=Hermanssonia centrifuga TaxID=98765 RepID=A0A2R6NQ40_9APHY|nr:hypothetical protein PHLCEN_2v9973 [Hermanssonia centrifuga]